MLGRRLLVLFAVLLGLTALATSLAPRPTTPGGALSTPAATPSAVPSVDATETRAGRELTRTISADSGARPARVRAHVGDTLRLAVRGTLLDAVEIEGFGELEAITPEAPARFELLLEEPGEFGVTLTEAKRSVGVLEVAR